MRLIEWLVWLLPERKKVTTEVPIPRLGLTKDPYDERDYLMLSSEIEEDTPESVFFDSFCPETENQGKANSCTAFSGTSAFETAREKDGDYYISFSEHDLYYFSRKDANLFPDDGGCYMRNVLKVMKERGLCPEKLEPYDENDINRTPGIFAKWFASFFRIKAYVRLQSQSQIRQALADGGIVMIGTPIYKGFMKPEANIIPIPKKSEASIGAHAYYIVGYSKTREQYLIHNSWGSWANGGFAWLPFEYLDKIAWFDAWLPVK